MFLNSKPLLYLQLLDRSLRYLAIHPKNHSIIDKGKIIFDTNILEDGRIINTSLLETRLDALVKEKKWKNAKAHILLLNDFVTIRDENVPSQLTSSEVRDYLELHINQSIRIPIENPKFDFGIIGKNEYEQKIFIIAYPSDAVNLYQNILQNVSLKPTVADISALSLYRVAEQRGTIKKDKDHHTLLLEWNPYDLSIMVFNQDRPTFNRHSQSPRLSESWELTHQGEWIWRQTNLELETMLEDQLNGLERFLDFYQYSILDGNGSISEIILTGYYPNLNALKERLNSRFALDVSLLNMPKDIDQHFSALYGLTLREETGGGRE